MRDDLEEMNARLDVAEAVAVAETLPHRRKYLLLNHKLARRILAAHLEWLDEVETELAPAGARKRRSPAGSARPSA